MSESLYKVLSAGNEQTHRLVLNLFLVYLVRRVHLNFVRAKHSGRQFISENQRFTAGMLRPYEDLCKHEMHPVQPVKSGGYL